MKEILQYIADSPQKKYGGFDDEIIAAAKWAIEKIEQIEAENKRLREAARHTMQMLEAEYGGMLSLDDEGLEPQTSYRMLKDALGNCSNPAAETKQKEKDIKPPCPNF